MVTYNEILAKANTVYYKSCSVLALEGALNEICALLNEKMLSDAGRENGEALKLRAELKIKTLEFFENISLPPIYAVLSAAEKAQIAAQAKGYKKTETVAKNVISLMEGCKRILTDTEEISARLNGDTDGDICEKLLSAAEAAERKIAAVLPKNPFGEASFIDVDERLVRHVSRLKEKISAVRAQTLERVCAAFAKDISAKYRGYEYFPLSDYDEGGKPNAKILCTPFFDEARLFAVNDAKDKTVYEFSGAAIEGNAESFIDEVFAYIEAKGGAVLFAGVEKIVPYKLARLLKRAMQAGKRGISAYICDCTGGSLYSQAMDIGGSEKGLSTLDISAEYLSMPPYNDVCRELEDKGIIADGQYGAVKEMPFAGFAGLNKIVRTFIASGDKNCLSAGKKISDGNFAAAKAYLSKVRSAYQLLDSGWGDFSAYAGESGQGAGEFDYDGVHEVDLDNIKLIVESGETLFAKCGMVARYCTTGGGDYSEWEHVPREEMEERVTLATRLVFRLLGVETVPQVEISDELSNGTAGGLCCDGGKRILYKYSCALNWQWLVRAIVHESFHAMQSKLCAGGWSEWYYENLGITRGRVERWKETNKSELYDNNTRSKVYKVHIYENDAYAFETDCDDALAKCWNAMEFR